MNLQIVDVCCTCLSRDRNLSLLFLVPNGLNYLDYMLSQDTVAYGNGFNKETIRHNVCWECKALFLKFNKFKTQACIAQKQILKIKNGLAKTTSEDLCLSNLSQQMKNVFDTEINSEGKDIDNFVDCGPDLVIQEEDEGIPLSELNRNELVKRNCIINIETKIKRSSKSKKNFRKGKTCDKIKKNKEVANLQKAESKNQYYLVIHMNDVEMATDRLKRLSDVDFIDSEFKCESCIQSFERRVDFELHKLTWHEEKKRHTQCDVCLSYVNSLQFKEHALSHHKKYICRLCDSAFYLLEDVKLHLKNVHEVDISADDSRMRNVVSTSKKRINDLAGYPCLYCNSFFSNKSLRWKHVQRSHSPGHQCSFCKKRFAFRNNLIRHELIHREIPPRTECPTCHKKVRVSLMAVHARTHSTRQHYSCVDCNKKFLCKATYVSHLKNSKAHSDDNALKYKCPSCDKRFRSRGELKDHNNYRHLGKTEHQCTVCGKALATRRCLRRHIKRTHEGIKEQARDKICQQCGKTFRDKKGLREHELIHTGERPLSCEICGCTFRQNSSLYTHRKRVHNICPQKRTVAVVVAES